MIEDERNDQDAPEGQDAPDEAQQGAPEEGVAPAEEPEKGAEDAPAEGEGPAAEQPEEPAAEQPAAEQRPRKKGKKDDSEKAEEVIPGAHLEPDLVLEEEQERPAYAEDLPVEEAEADQVPVPDSEPEAQPAAAAPLDLAADARYQATGKRKSAVARVILKPGDGTYSVNGRGLDQFFPRYALQTMARQPLDATGNAARMDVVARIHGGGVAAQAGALRHGIARALVEADPNLRTELKRRGYLTRDPRVKERKKAGLKKARKRPQFSKR